MQGRHFSAVEQQPWTQLELEETDEQLNKGEEHNIVS